MKIELNPPGYSSVRIPGAPDYGLPKPAHLEPAPSITIERSGSFVVLTQGRNRLDLNRANISSLKLDGLKPGKGQGFIDVLAESPNGSKQKLISYWIYSDEVANWLVESKGAIESIFGLSLELNFSSFEDDI